MTFETFCPMRQVCQIIPFSILDTLSFKIILSFWTKWHFRPLGILDSIAFWIICHSGQFGIFDNYVILDHLSFRQFGILDNLSFCTICHFGQLGIFWQFAILDYYVISDSLSFWTICHFGPFVILDNLSFWTMAFWIVWCSKPFGEFSIRQRMVVPNELQYF